MAGLREVAPTNSVRIDRVVPREPRELEFMLNDGDAAPHFELPDAEMEMVCLDAYLGKYNVVLYFYPKDDTPGCTIEAIDFSELEDRFLKFGAVVIGVSMDDCLAHGAFREIGRAHV